MGRRWFFLVGAVLTVMAVGMLALPSTDLTGIHGRELAGAKDTRKKPNVTVLVTWASVGDYAYGYSTDVMSEYWNQHLQNKYNSDPTWPFYANVELVDYESNLTYITQFLSQRLNKSSPLGQPPVSVVIAPEGNVGVTNAHIADQFGIPYILTSSNPSPTVAGLPSTGLLPISPPTYPLIITCLSSHNTLSNLPSPACPPQAPPPASTSKPRPHTRSVPWWISTSRKGCRYIPAPM